MSKTTIIVTDEQRSLLWRILQEAADDRLARCIASSNDAPDDKIAKAIREVKLLEDMRLMLSAEVISDEQ